MPTMMEIYERHADRYDELVRAEDHQHHVPETLRSICDWTGLSVMEAGVGTGRVTRMYVHQVARAVLCDRSQHMLDFARRSLSIHRSKLEFHRVENASLPGLDRKVDAFLQGWSFGHSAVDCGSDAELEEVTDLLVRNSTKNVHSGGVIVFLETLGTNLDSPTPPHPMLAAFYRRIEDRHGFKRQEIRTDYRFDTNEQAVDVMGFFFGLEMENSVRNRGTAVIPEWTGVWVKRT